MFNTRKEVDEHVHKLLVKLPAGSERDSKGYTIAKLYCKINEFPKAIEYLNAFLKIKDEAAAHKLMAHCYKHVKPPENNKALQHYNRSILLNGKQVDVIKDACQLLLDDNSVYSDDKARFWCDLAAKENVSNSNVVLELLLKRAHKSDNRVCDDHTFEMLMHKEIQDNPQDVAARVRLLRSYMEKAKLQEAFDYAHKTELEIVSNNSSLAVSEWYNIVWQVLNRFEIAKDTKKGWQYWQLLLLTLERLVHLSLRGGDNNSSGPALSESSKFLFKFDQYLYKFSQSLDKQNDNTLREMHLYCLEHYAGQLLLHCVAFLCKRELLNNKNKWKDTLRNALPLILLGCHLDALKGKPNLWLKHCDSAQKRQVEIWKQEGAFRRAQLGRTLYGCVLDEQHQLGKENQAHFNLGEGNQPQGLWENSDAVLSFVRQICLDKNWRRQIYQVLFTHSEQKIKDPTSLLVRYAKLQEPFYEWPHIADIETDEQLALVLQPQSLSHHVYLAMSSNNLVEAPRVKYYEGMKQDTKENLSYCGVDSLSKLDVDTFLYAVVLQAQRKMQVQRETYDRQNVGNRSAAAKPHMLPYVNVAAHLASDEQLNWWTLAYKLHTNTAIVGNRAEQRTQLQYGLEAVRGINGPRADIFIIFRLGQLLTARGQGAPNSLDKSGLQARIESLYRQGFNMLKRRHLNQLDIFPRYFKYADSSATYVWQQVDRAAEDAVSYFCSRYFKQGKYEQFLDVVRGLQLPMATYMMAEAYRHLEESNKTPRVSRVRYSDQRQECLQQTQQMLRDDSDHPLSSVIHRELRRCNQEKDTLACKPRYSIGQDGGVLSPDLHNNSSNYFDSESDFYADAAQINRSRHAIDTATASAVNQELEQLIKQMNKTFTMHKEDVCSSMQAMRQDIKSLTDKFSTLEEIMKKCRISNSRDTPTRDADAAAAAAALGLDDLFIMEDTLDQQHQQQQPTATLPAPSQSVMPPMPLPFTPGYFNSTQTGPAGQERFYTPNAFGSPLYNQPQMFNYYSQYMRPPQPGQGMTQPTLFGGSRNSYVYPPTGAPFMDALNNYVLPMPPVTTAALNNHGLPPQVVPQHQPSLIPQQPPVAAAAPTPAAAPPATLNTQLLGENKTAFFNAQPFGPSQVVPPPQIAAPQPKPTFEATPAVSSSITIFNKALNNQPVEKVPPANVVITNSDPLPKPAVAGSNVVAAQPTLSVTIPPQHIKPSIVQASIDTPPTNTTPMVPSALPTGGFSFNFAGTGGGTNMFNVFSTNKTATTTSAPVTTTVDSGKSPLFTRLNIDNSNASAPTFSFKSQVAEAAAQKEKEQADAKVAAVNESAGSDLNKSFCEEPDYDPRPDFQGIIPLPDEVVVRTGEEEEEILFEYRAKLFRLIEKEWKERGIGTLKILKSKTGHSRVLMRREQTHKICANFKITPDLELSVPEKDKEEKSFIWAANDFADEELRLETFLVRFKLTETAAVFKKAFYEARQKAVDLQEQSKLNGGMAEPANSSVAPKSFVTSTPAHATPTKTESKSQPEASSNATKSLFANATKPESNSSPFANFSFGNAIKEGTNNSTPFGTFSFGNVSGVTPSNSNNTTLAAFVTATGFGAVSNSNTTSEKTVLQNKATTSDAEDEYVPTAQFTPVISLPELVEVRTGEENELVLFEHRAKLLRFVKATSEWKDRGIGNIKLLQNKDDVNQVRLVMRREQVHKLCCNQRILKETNFQYHKNSKEALTWAGQDYSEEELTKETLCVRFKKAETCQQFLDAILKAQAAMSADIGGDCKPNQETKKDAEKLKADIKGFGDAFKPKTGSWNCTACYTTNQATDTHCLCCEMPKDDTVPPKQSGLEQMNALNLSVSTGKFSFGFPSAGTGTATTNVTNKPTSGFTFGAPANVIKPDSTTVLSTSTNTSGDFTNASTKTTSSFTFGATANATNPVVKSTTITSGGFGDAFKAKPGAWSCNTCYVSNGAENLYCTACEAPKDETVPKKDNALGGGGLVLPATNKFSFGFGNGNAPISSGTNSSATGGPPANATFSFGATLSSTQSAPAATTNVLGGGESTIFGTPSFKFAAPSASSTTLAPAGTLLGSNTFSFVMPKAVQQADSATAVPEEHTGDEYYQEDEENNAYFAPVIPLPDKIEVKTGEEDENLLYVHRAKLYRLIDGEWKERGLGNVKILQHKETKKLRVVMRREQVLKICLNHALDSSVIYKEKDDKSCIFAVHDFSEGESIKTTFSLRFKNAEISKAFINAVNLALAGKLPPIVEDSSANTRTSPALPQPAVTDEIKALAEKLMLPYEFFTAETKCSGCRGCEPEKFDFGLSTQASNYIDALPTTLPKLKLSDQQSKAPGLVAASRLIIKPSTVLSDSNTNILGNLSTETPKANNVSFSLTDSLKKNSNESGNDQTGIQSQTPISGGFLFGCNEKQHVFGETPSLFTGNTKQSSIFGSTSSNGGETKTESSLIRPATATTTPAPSIFGGSLFSGTGNNVFANNNSNSPTPGFLFGSQTTSFASLATESESNPNAFQKSSTGGFFGLTHQDAFKHFLQPGMNDSAKNKSLGANDTNNSATNDGNGTTDENYDPHYEPIIALPDEIVLSTGEENEKKLFGDRATLFRYDPDMKQWKERGVGELKILEHAELKTYRMVMRREQIHKLVLNMKIGGDFVVENMNNNKKSFLWAHFNYAESTEGTLERLACRFKKEEPAEKFIGILNECIKNAKKRDAEE